MKFKLTIIMAAALAGTAFADIVFLGGLVGESASWDGGVLPTTSGNPGVISDGDVGQVGNHTSLASEISAVGLFIRQDGGTIGSTSYRGSEFDATTWTVNGGAISGNGIQLKNGSLLTLNSGGSIIAASGRDIIISASTFTVNGGTLSIGDELSISSAGGTFNLNGGTVTAGKAGTGFNSTGTFNFNSGSFAAATWGNFEKLGDRTLNFGAGTGTVSFDTFYSLKTTMNWDAESEFELTIAGADSAFYENLWDTSVLQVDGANLGTFADSGFTVTGSTLTIPEPAVMGLLSLSGLGMLVFRRFSGRA
jgi:hypothetical protein